MNLYIFRHGETFFSKNQINYGDKVESAEILPEATKPIKKLAKYLTKVTIDKNFTSPYKRCLQTTGIVTEITGKKFEIDNDLRDWDPRVETVQEMIERLKTFCQNLERNKYASVCICTHGYPINSIIAYFTKGHIREADLPNFPIPGVLVSLENSTTDPNDRPKVSYTDFNERP